MESPHVDNAVHAELLQHKGAMQLALRYKFDNLIHDHLKKLDGIKWSQTHRCFYIPHNRDSIRRLLNHCRGIVWVDIRQINTAALSRMKGSKPVKSTKYHPQLSELIIAQIDGVKAYMQQRRYADATIKNYINLLEVY